MRLLVVPLICLLLLANNNKQFKIIFSFFKHQMKKTEYDNSMLAVFSRKGYVAKTQKDSTLPRNVIWDVIYTAIDPYKGMIHHVPGAGSKVRKLIDCPR